MTEHPSDIFVETRMRLHRLGPKPQPIIPGTCLGSCAACGGAFQPGAFTMYMVLGPGADPELRRQARSGERCYGFAVEVHWSCATGQE